MEGKELKSIYIMLGSEMNVEKIRKNEMVDLWHVGFGHVRYNQMKVMMKKSMLRGLSNLEIHDNIIFVSC